VLQVPYHEKASPLAVLSPPHFAVPNYQNLNSRSVEKKFVSPQLDKWDKAWVFQVRQACATAQTYRSDRTYIHKAA
jgi:hypothetical protein